MPFSFSASTTRWKPSVIVVSSISLVSAPRRQYLVWAAFYTRPRDRDTLTPKPPDSCRGGDVLLQQRQSGGKAPGAGPRCNEGPNKGGTNVMSTVSRRSLHAASAMALAVPGAARADTAKPKVTVISQWSAGSDGLAISTLGKRFEAEGGVWEHNPVPGFTTEMMNKLRAQIIAGDPPAASQLKGPEIAAWSKIGAVVDLDPQVQAAGYEAVVPAELVRLSKPYGHWIALPIQAYRINTLFISKKAADKVGMTKLPTTWAEFNAIAEKMKAAGITPVANGGIKWDDGMKWEIALCVISPGAYRKAVMELDDKTLMGPDVLAAFRQTRKLADWSDPGA